MVFLVIIAIIINVVLKSPSVKGYFGELAICILLKFLDKEKYRILNNVMISKDGRSTQIDHIVVSIYGVFVIETKNYKGWISGSENEQYWRQTIYKAKNKFYNPILQNKGHVNALKALLIDFPNIKFIPIVAFTLKADFKKLDVTSHVIYSSQILNIIRMYTEANITPNDLDKITQSILDANAANKITKREHISRIKNNQTMIELGICPRCGGSLIERNSSYGSFKGCNNFPKCKFILKGK